MEYCTTGIETAKETVMESGMKPEIKHGMAYIRRKNVEWKRN